MFKFLKEMVKETKTAPTQSVGRDMTDPSRVNAFSLGNPFSAYNHHNGGHRR